MKLNYEYKYYDICDYYVVNCPYGAFEVYSTYNYRNIDSKCQKCEFLKVDCGCQKPTSFKRDIGKNKRTLLLLKEKSIKTEKKINNRLQMTDV